MVTNYMATKASIPSACIREEKSLIEKEERVKFQTVDINGILKQITYSSSVERVNMLHPSRKFH